MRKKYSISIASIMLFSVLFTGCAAKEAAIEPGQNNDSGAVSEEALTETSGEASATESKNEGTTILDSASLPEGTTIIDSSDYLTDEEIIAKYDLNNLSDSDLDMLINSMNSNDYIRQRIVTMRHTGALTGQQNYWGSAEDVPEWTPFWDRIKAYEYTEDYDYKKYLKDNYNYNPWDGDLNDFWALLSKSKKLNERMSIAVALNKYFQYDFDWDTWYSDNCDIGKYTDEEINNFMSSEDRIKSLTDKEISLMTNEQMMRILNYCNDYYNSDTATDLGAKWANTRAEVVYNNATHNNYVFSGDYYFADLMMYDEFYNKRPYSTKFGLWASYYLNMRLDLKDYKAGDKLELIDFTPNLDAIDRGVPLDTEYTKEEFYARIKELHFENINVLRRTFGNFVDSAEIKPFIEGDDWTNAYADQRAYESLYSFSTGYFLFHNRPHVRMNPDGYSWTVDDWYSDGLAWDRQYWPENYYKFVRGENLATGYRYSKKDFKYNEEYAQKVADSTFWGLWAEGGHLEGMLKYSYSHCSVGVYMMEDGDDYIFGISQELYSTNNENGYQPDYLWE